MQYYLLYCLRKSQYQFPTTISVTDCTHIDIKKPSIHGDEYINRKGKPTLNVQSTCESPGNVSKCGGMLA